MGFFRGKGGRQEVTLWRSLRPALLLKFSYRKDQRDTEVQMNPMDVKARITPSEVTKQKRGIHHVWRNNLQAYTPLTSGFLKGYISFSPENAVSPKHKMKEEDGSRRTQCVLGFQTCRSTQWVLGKTASSLIWLSFHYFITIFPSIFSFSQCYFERDTAWKHTILAGGG